MFNFRRYQQTIFQNGCTYLHSQQRDRKVTVAHHHVIRLVFTTLAILMGVVGVYIVVLICISLSTNGVEREPFHVS